MTERTTRRNPRQSKKHPSSQKSIATYSVRELHELLDLAIERGGQAEAELFLEQWLCKSGESGLSLIG